MRRFTGKGFFGLNDNLDPSMIDDDEVSSCSNMRVNDDLSIQKRPGYHVSMTGESNPILDMEQVSIGDDRSIIYATKSDIKRKVGTSQETLLTGLSGVDEAQLFQFNDTLFMANGVDEIKKTKIVSEEKIAYLSNNILYLADKNFIQTESFNLGYTANYLTSDSQYIYISDATNKAVKKYDYKFNLIASVDIYAVLPAPVLTVPYQICNNNTDVFVVHAYSAAAFCVSKISKSTFSIITHTSGSTTLGSETQVACNSSYLYIYDNTDGILRTLNASDLAVVSTEYLVFGSISQYWIVVVDGGLRKLVASSALEMMYPRIGYTVEGLPVIGDYVIRNYGGKLCSMYSPSLNKVFIVGLDSKIKDTITFDHEISDYTYKPNNLTKWQDLCSPGQPIQNETEFAGNVGDGATDISYRYTAYNTLSLAETSGGATSEINNTVNAKQNEVFFDFNLATQWQEGKCEDIGVNTWRLYRKEGANDYKLALSVPIYRELSESMNTTATTLSLTATTYTGYPLNPDGTQSTNNFYILVGDEIMLVDGTTAGTNTWTVARAQKGTTAQEHDQADFAYIFSVIDNTATSSLGTVCPIKNDYVENCKLMTSHNGRFWMANSAENPSRVWYSSVNADTGNADEDIILESSYFDINRNDGDEITAIYPYMGNLLVFKKRSMWYIYGDGESAGIYNLKETVGCMSQKGIVEYGNTLLFPSYEGWMILAGNEVFNMSNSKIRNFWNGINWNYAYKMCAEKNMAHNEIWLSVPYSTSTENNRVIVLKTNISDFKGKNSFMIWTRDISCMELFDYDSTFQTVTANMMYLFSGSSTGGINQENYGVLDDTAAISSSLTTKRFSMDYDRHKKFKRLILDYEGQGENAYTISYQYGTDKTSIGTVNTITTGGAGMTSERTHIREFLVNPENPEGSYIYFVFSNSTEGHLMQIYNLSIDYKTGKVR